MDVGLQEWLVALYEGSYRMQGVGKQSVCAGITNTKIISQADQPGLSAYSQSIDRHTLPPPPPPLR